MGKNTNRTMTTKGRITIPKPIRDRQGHVIMLAKNVDIRELRGIIRSRRKTPVSIEEMNEAIARGWSGT